MSKIRQFLEKYDIFWSSSVLFVFTEYNIGGIDTKIKFLSPFCTNLHAFLDLVAMQQHENPKIDHIS